MTDPSQPVNPRETNRVSGLFNYLNATFHEVRHGALLKFLAVASRLLFLLFVVPGLLPGELTLYLFLSSVAVVAARLLGLGLDEQLPLIISGSIETLKKHTPIVDFLIAIQFVLAIIVAVAQSQTAALVLLTCCYVTTIYLSGSIRTIRITGAERLRDLHWIAFGLIALLLPIEWSAMNLVLLMSACLMSVHFLEIHINTQSGIEHAMHIDTTIAAVRQLGDPIRRSWRKLIASVVIILIVRSVVLWPKALGVEGILADIAYALMLGEAFMQTAMIVVYRKFAHYCANKNDFSYIFNDQLKNVGIILTYTVITAIGTSALGLLDFQISGFSNWPAVSWMVLFFGFLSCYRLVRYVVWVHRDFDWRLSVAEVLLVALQGLIVYYLPQSLWPTALTACTALLLTGTLLFAWLTTKHSAQEHATH